MEAYSLIKALRAFPFHASQHPVACVLEGPGRQLAIANNSAKRSLDNQPYLNHQSIEEKNCDP